MADTFFGALPPEVNSGLMYAGPGSGPVLTAAASWDALGAELSSAAIAYQAVISTLAEKTWQGPTAVTMAAAVAPYIAWLSATGARAEQAAAQARAAAGAYEMAFTATVPPWLVAANRSTLMTLIATNLLGQNTAAIAATEANYAEMWAQDAAAMGGYAAASAAATRLMPFTQPPRVANPGGSTSQAGAAAQAAGTSTAGKAAVQAVAASAQATPDAGTQLVIGTLTPQILAGLAGVPWLFAMQNVTLPIAVQTLQVALRKADALGLLGEAPVAGAVPGLAPNTLSSSGAGHIGTVPTAVAGIGRGDTVGALSVPRAWSAAGPEVRTFTTALPTTVPATFAAAVPEGQAAALGGAATGTLTGRALGATGAAASRAVGKVGKTASGDEQMPTTTIVVIPESDDGSDDE